MTKLYTLTRIAEDESGQSLFASSITDLFFSSVTKAIARLELENIQLYEPYGLAEGFYKYAVIEEASIDGQEADEFYQLWYELKKQEDGSYLWIEIECPEKFERTTCFYHCS